MTRDAGGRDADRREAEKRARLASALRDNLKRRKAQARAVSALGPAADGVEDVLDGAVDRPSHGGDGGD